MRNKIDLDRELTTDQLGLQAKIIKRLKIFNHPDPERVSREIINFSSSSGNTVDQIIDRLENQEPIEYIFGYKNFYGQELKVTHHTLIPRIETEVLIERSIEIGTNLLKSGTRQVQIIDIGTGSGAIIISIASELKQDKERIKFTATDISEHALKISQLNAKALVPDIDIQFIRSNLLKDAKLDSDSPTLLCANLPYISTADYHKLERSVHEYEPKIALEAGKDGLDLYRALWNQIQELGLKNFILISEMGPEQIEKYIEIVKTAFNTSENEIVKDMFGIERFVISKMK